MPPYSRPTDTKRVPHISDSQTPFWFSIMSSSLDGGTFSLNFSFSTVFVFVSKLGSWFCKQLRIIQAFVCCCVRFYPLTIPQSGDLFENINYWLGAVRSILIRGLVQYLVYWFFYINRKKLWILTNEYLLEKWNESLLKELFFFFFFFLIVDLAVLNEY